MTENKNEMHPARYCSGKYECKDVLKDRLAHKNLSGIEAFFYGCVFKYLWRYGEKDEKKKEIHKMKNYLDFMEQEA